MTLLSTYSDGMFDIMTQIHEGENLNWLCVYVLHYSPWEGVGCKLEALNAN